MKKTAILLVLIAAGAGAYIYFGSAAPELTSIHSAAPESNSPQGSQQSAASSAVTEHKPEVTLIDAGAEPRSPRELHLTKGQTFAALMTMKMEMKFTTGGKEAPASPPITTNFPLDIEVQDVDSSGKAKLFAKYGTPTLEKSGLPEQLQQNIQAQYSQLSGMSCDYHLLPDGSAEGAQCRAPNIQSPLLSGMIQQINQYIGRSYVPFPREPLGAGAKWKVVIPDFMAMGIKSKVDFLYELKSVEGDVWHIAGTTENHAAEQEVNEMPSAPGVKLHLKSLDSTGSMDIETSPAALIPTCHGSTTSTAIMTTAMAAAPESAPVEVRTDSKMEMSLVKR